jgi:hypothetical protein
VKYSDDNEARLGDRVAISVTYRGIVVACLDRDEYTADYPREQWSYLGKGVLVNTDFGGLVHYEDASQEHFTLISRAHEA